MPNHVTNRISVTGLKEDRDRLKDFLRFKHQGQEETPLSFNSFIPMPQELMETTSGSGVVESIYLVDPEMFEKAYEISQRTIWDEKMPIAAYEAKMLCNLMRTAKWGQPDAEPFPSREEALAWFTEHNQKILEFGERHAKALRNTGYLDWYTWSIANWGTKWDAYSVRLEETDDKLIYQFDTAWSPPTPFIEKMVETFQMLDFEHWYFDEGHNFWGIACYSAGEQVVTRESLKEDRNPLCIELKGYDPDDEEDD